MSKTYSEIYRETLEKIKDYCNRNISRIDRLCEGDIARESDILESYIFRQVLNIINESGVEL